MQYFLMITYSWKEMHAVFFKKLSLLLNQFRSIQHPFWRAIVLGTRVLHPPMIVNPFSLFFFIDFQDALHGRIQSLSYVRRLYGNAISKSAVCFFVEIGDSP